ncbi:MAG: hypothetical protein HN474_10520 [Nitrospina sp.]|nr:hypothetical protein [Nitrospina sp.]
MSRTDLKEGNWFEKAVFISGQMKSGGTLLREMLDGNPDFFVVPDLPFFRRLFHENFTSDKHRAVDWLIGHHLNFFQEPCEKPFNFNPFKENNPIPREYSDLPLSSIKLKGSIRAFDLWGKFFSIETYHENLKTSLEQNLNSEKNIINSTVSAMLQGFKDKTLVENIFRWGYRGPHSARTSIFNKVQLQNNEVEQFFKLFPEGQAVFVVRNPHAIISSRNYHFKVQRSSYGAIHRFINFLNDCKVTHESLKQLIAYQTQYSEKKLMIIRFEDLVQNPEEVMKKVCFFLRIKYSSNMTYPTILGQSVKVLTARGVDGSKVEKNKAIQWKTELSKIKQSIIDAFIIREADHYEKRWGYEVDSSKTIAWIANIFIFTPILFMCEKFGELIYRNLNQFKDFIGWNYMGEKILANVRYDNDHSQSYENFFGGSNFIFLQRQFSKYAEEKNLNHFKRILIIGEKYSVFSLHLANKADLVHIIDSEEKISNWINKTANHLRLENITIHSKSLDVFDPKIKYDLVIWQGDSHDKNKTLGDKIGKISSILSDEGRLYVTALGFGHPLSQMLLSVLEKKYKIFWGTLKNLVGTVLFCQILQKENHLLWYCTKRRFREVLSKNGFYIEQTSFVDSVVFEEFLPPKIGTFIRKYDSICRKKNPTS